MAVRVITLLGVVIHPPVPSSRLHLTRLKFNTNGLPPHLIDTLKSDFDMAESNFSYILQTVSVQISILHGPILNLGTSNKSNGSKGGFTRGTTCFHQRAIYFIPNSVVCARPPNVD
ncbi:hypothetical protein POM88_036061 [Heracleum sosnowskyi]|uniref:Uncharacterized protein n=1 Tax=Heracleum sosnowskyi TaxID=360622 RepID=A0AAD8HMM4_9APIA|nr:hypothetical protein POM88_036061 [Heracleum sosnowskyi]